MFTFSFEDKIKFTKAVYYHFHKIPLPKPFKDGTGGMGKFAALNCMTRKVHAPTWQWDPGLLRTSFPWS